MSRDFWEAGLLMGVGGRLPALGSRIAKTEVCILGKSEHGCPLDTGMGQSVIANNCVKHQHQGSC